MQPKIGIIGMGFIGRAIAHGFSLVAEVKIYDKYNDTFDTLDETVNQSDFLFVGVPTPMDDNGKQDQSYLEDAIESIAEIATERKIIIIKSTVVPGTGYRFQNKYMKHSFVSNPEFLTERIAKLDFINTARIILGGTLGTTEKVKELYRLRFPHTPIYQTSWEGAEVIKYMCNCFFALKVSFCNEMYDVANHVGVSYEELKNMWLADMRIGNSHCDVPGHDGDRGYGGKCFKKDVAAFIRWAEKENLNVDTIKAADTTNDRVRTLNDWDEIKGATSNCKY